MEDRFHNTSNNLEYEEELDSEDDAPVLRLRELEINLTKNYYLCF